MTDEQLHKKVTSEFYGMTLAASVLLTLMDRPGMSLTELRRSAPAETFRDRTRRCRKWVRDAINCTPGLSEVQKRELAKWYMDQESAAAEEPPTPVTAEERDQLSLMPMQSQLPEFGDVT